MDENVPVGTTVGTFTTTDPDASSSHTYSLVLGPGAADNSAFYIDGNQLQLQETPDFETQSSYSIRVRTTDSGSLFAEQAFTITVTDGNDAPFASFGFGGIRREGSPLSFDASASSDADGDALTYAWNFGDGNTGTGVAPSHIYTDNGTFIATLTVDDGNGGTDTVERTVTVNNVAPTVDIGADVTIEQGETFSVSGLFNDPGDDSWNATVNYSDGSGDETLALNPDKSFDLSHVYADIGTYSVSVTVQDNDGGSDTDTLTVVVLRAAAPDLTVSDFEHQFLADQSCPGRNRHDQCHHHQRGVGRCLRRHGGFLRVGYLHRSVNDHRQPGPGGDSRRLTADLIPRSGLPFDHGEG